MNIVIISGNLTKDPEVGTTSTGTNYARFSIAVRKNKDETNFFNCVAWKSTAELIGKYCVKGSKISLQGELSQRTYEKNGIKQTVNEIIVNQVEFNFTKQQDDKKEISNLTPVDDELPF